MAGEDQCRPAIRGRQIEQACARRAGSRKGKAVADRSQERRPGPGKMLAELEAESEAVLEKTARLKALRLAREASTKAGAKKKPRKGEKSATLSEWLATRQKEGRSN